MSESPTHTVTWTVEDEGTTEAAINCSAPPWSECNRYCPEPTCEEYISNIECVDGVWQHDYDHGDEPEIHRLVTTSDCSYMNFMDDEGPAFYYQGGVQPVRDGAVEFSWDGDYYTWAYVDNGDRVVTDCGTMGCGGCRELQFLDERDRARATAVHFEQQIAAVARLHSKVNQAISGGWMSDGTPVVPTFSANCGYCHGSWPCSTARAIGGDL